MMFEAGSSSNRTLSCSVFNLLLIQCTLPPPLPPPVALTQINMCKLLKSKIFKATRLYIGIRLRAPGLKYRVSPTLYPAVHPFRPFPNTSLKVLSSHSNWGARLESFHPLLNSRCPASLKFFLNDTFSREEHKTN
jgi:hypothetical protein